MDYFSLCCGEKHTGEKNYSPQKQNWSLIFIGYYYPHNNTMIKSKGCFEKFRKFLILTNFLKVLWPSRTKKLVLFMISEYKLKSFIFIFSAPFGQNWKISVPIRKRIS